MDHLRERGVGRISVLVVLGLLAGLLVISATTSQATFPGSNGLVAFVRTGDVFTTLPGAIGETRITFSGGFADVNWNPASTQLVAGKGGVGVVFLNPTPGSSETLLFGTTGADFNPGFNNNGTRVTFDSAGDIFVQTIGAPDRTNITGSAAIEVAPEWSADGTFIVAEDNTAATIFRISPTGTLRVAITPGPAATCPTAADCDEPTISPDNLRVAFDDNAGAVGGIFSVLADGSSAAAAQLSAVGTHAFPHFSPNPHFLVITTITGLGRLASDGSAGISAITTTAGDTAASWGSAGAAVPSPSPVVGSPTPVVPPGQFAVVIDPGTGCANAATTAAAQAAGYSVGCGTAGARKLNGGNGRDLLVAGNGFAGKINAKKGNDCVAGRNNLRNKLKGGKGTDTLASSDVDDKVRKFEATSLGTCPTA